MRARITPNEFWQMVRDSDISEVNEISLRKMIVVDVTDDPDIQVREIGTGTVHDEPYRRTRTSRRLSVGDPVLVGEIRGRGLNLSATRVIIDKLATTAGEGLTSSDITNFTSAAADAVNALVPHGYVSSGRMAILGNLIPVGSTSAQTLVANRMYYIPFFVPTTRNYDAVLFEIMTVASGNVQCGIYECDVSNFLPTNRLAMGTKTLYGATGVKTQTFTAVSLVGGRWYFAGLASVTAHAIRGTSVSSSIPSLRGGMNTDLVTANCLAFEALTAGWTDIPAVANAGAQADLYLTVGARG
jgi:hypothetical protein